MGKLFNDPEYNRMANDEEAWLELAIEPFRSYLNDIIRSLPDSVEIGFDEIFELLKSKKNDYHLSIPVSAMLKDTLRDYVHKDLSHKELEIIERIYEARISDDTVINFVDKTINKQILLKKKQKEIPEDEILNISADLSTWYISVRTYSSQHPMHGEIVSRFNEIIDIVGADEQIRKTRSLRKKLDFIINRVNKIIREDEWRIRDYSIMVDLCKNITSYVNEGNMHALMNITRLKCMTHKGAPIYSMEDIR